RVLLRWDGADERVARDPVGALRKDRHTVEHEAEEARAWLRGIWRLIERERPDPDVLFGAVHDFAAAHQVDSQLIQGRISEVMGPPPPGPLDPQVHRLVDFAVVARAERDLAAGGVIATAGTRRLKPNARTQRAAAGETLRLDA